MLTGARLGEVRQAQFGHFNLDHLSWSKPASMTKQRKIHRLPISDEAAAIVRQRQLLETRRNQHGERSVMIVVGTGRVLSRGIWRTVEVLACPVTWRPHPDQIASARRAYEDWWKALDWLRDGLAQGSGMLRDVDVNPSMPKRRPWR